MGLCPNSYATAARARPISAAPTSRAIQAIQAIIDGAKATGADLRGFDLRRLADGTDLKIDPDQQFALLDALGVDVRPEKV